MKLHNKKQSAETLYHNKNDNYETPRWLLTVFEDWFDPCPIGGKNGLEIAWGKKTYLNPPYSNPMPWVEKAIEESKNGNMVVLLLKLDTSTKWFFKLQENNAHFITFFGRLRFGNQQKPAPFPSVLAILEGRKT